MATFITIGYGDSAGYEQTDASVRDASHAHDVRLRANGAGDGQTSGSERPPREVARTIVVGSGVPGPSGRCDAAE